MNTDAKAPAMVRPAKTKFDSNIFKSCGGVAVKRE